MKKIGFLFIIFCFLSLVFSSSGSYAQEATEDASFLEEIFGENVEFDIEESNKKTSKIPTYNHRYLSTFLEVAFPNKHGYIRFPEVAYKNPAPSNIHQKILSKYLPKYASIIDVEKIESIKGIPKHHVINKWVKDEVTISFEKTIAPDSVSYDRFSQRSKELAGEIEVLNTKINLDISYKPELKKAADIVIVLHGYVPKRVAGNILGDNLRDWESSLYSQVQYAPESDYGVQGFFLTNGKNEIEKAYCYIPLYMLTFDDDWDKKTKGFTRECLIRSLGLPDAFQKSEQISAPNSILLNLSSKEEETKQYSSLKEFSFIDEIMLSYLYCDTIQAGSDVYRTIISLRQKNCIAHILK